MIGLVSFKVGAASAQLADVSGIAADGYRAAFLVSVSEAERVVATSQPTPMPPIIHLTATLVGLGERNSAERSGLWVAMVYGRRPGRGVNVTNDLKN